MEKIKYKDTMIYVIDNKYLNIGKKIVDNNINIIEILKDTKRNFVCIIKENEKEFILKEPRNETVIPQRKFMTLFKKGEALTTLININSLIKEKNFLNYSRPLVAIVKRKYGMINYSALVLENIKENKKAKKNLDEIVELIQKIHLKKIYHGDFNPSNFIISETNEIKIIDTQGKKMFFGNYRAHYDMLTMKLDSYEDMHYPYSKNIYYYLAFIMKMIKKLPFVEKIKKVKKILREKGWKI